MLSHQRIIFLLSFVTGSFIAGTLGCQTVQRQSAFLPPAQPPAIVERAAENQKPTESKDKTRDTGASKPEASPAAPAENSQEAKALAADPAVELIARVEKEYLAGQDNYRSGHLAAAKQNFDAAFNLLLGSGLDLQSDDRLQAELDRILDGTNTAELEALQLGDGFSEQKSEPAPIDEANEQTPAVDEKVKAKAEAEIKSTHSDLPLMMTDQVAVSLTTSQTVDAVSSSAGWRGPDVMRT